MIARLNLPERTRQATPENPSILSVELISGKVECRVTSQAGFKYSLQYKTEIDAQQWNQIPQVDGTGGEITLIDDDPRETRFYRIEAR
jgi:hypothetical protein